VRAKGERRYCGAFLTGDLEKKGRFEGTKPGHLQSGEKEKIEREGVCLGIGSILPRGGGSTLLSRILLSGHKEGVRGVSRDMTRV